ncbi:MAG: DNA helicase RecQ [bacterium]|nr:DNA helicase RecQ [bacterium]
MIRNRDLLQSVQHPRTTIETPLFDDPPGPPPDTSAQRLAAADLAALFADDEVPDSEAGLVPSPRPAGLPAPILDAPAGPPTEEELEAQVTALHEIVRHTFGFDQLRPMQGEAAQTVLAGRDLLLILPTGGGKSLCYQAPALVRSGLTVVVSPLISLMKDQLDGLRANGAPAAMMTSAQDGYELRETYRALEEQRIKLLFVAPERLVLPGFLDTLVRAGLRAIAVDEAHCISHWGHDFRPEYRQLGELRQRFPGLSMAAYTATATPRVRDDIVLQLGLAEPEILVGDFDRPNLTYRVQQRTGLLEQVMGVVTRHENRAGIVYAMRRKDVEKLARDMAGRGVRCLPYHAGLAAEERARVQEAFQSENIDVVVATVAFGMGIDRPDVRFVVHASLPKGIEQYSQETGRAGRDGLESECVLFYSGADFHGWKNLMERSASEAEAEGNANASADLDSSISRLEELWNYANSTVCRHKMLVEHFGGDYASQDGGCGACDVCLGELTVVEDALIVAQKILSCVVRCDQRFGAAHVADVLRGADTERIRRVGHERLSTYGLLSNNASREIRAWIDQLVAREHLAVTPGDYPTLYLTRSGAEVMKGEQEVSLFLPKKPARSSRKSRGLAAALDEGGPEPDAGLFEALRKLRRDLAREREVPPYILFNDRTLALLAGHKPKTAIEFRAIKGIGDKKAADLGPIFLAAIAEFVGDGS